MYFLIYVSSAAADFSSVQLRELLVRCEHNNRRNEISGMLLYKEGNFLQVIEGVEAAVLATYACIAADPRHNGLITLLQGPQRERQFPEWSMGFANLMEAPTPAGFTEFLHSPLTGTEFAGNPSRAQRMLLAFKTK